MLKFKNFKEKIERNFAVSFSLVNHHAEIRFVHVQTGRLLKTQLILNSQALKCFQNFDFEEIPLDLNIVGIQGDILPIKDNFVSIQENEDLNLYLKGDLPVFPLSNMGESANKLSYLLSLLSEPELLFLCNKIDGNQFELVNFVNGKRYILE